MIYFTDIYGLYSPMVVIIFECELRIVQYGYSLVIGRYPGPVGVGHVSDSMIFQTGMKKITTRLETLPKG